MKITRLFKRTVPLLALLLAAAVSGCAGRKEPTGGNLTSGGVDQSGGGAQPAMGRYVESAVEFPFEGDGETVTAVLNGPDGGIEMHTYVSQKHYKKYILKDGGWEPGDESLLNKMPSQDGGLTSAIHVAYAGNGDMLATYYSQDESGNYSVSVVRLPKTGEAQPLKLDALGDRLFITGIQGAEDGTVLILSGNELYCVAEDGTLKYTLPHKGIYVDWSDMVKVSQGACILAGEKSYLKYDLKTGEEIGQIPYQSEERDYGESLAVGADGDLYLCNPSGIHHISDGGAIWETLADGSLNSLGMPSIQIKRLFLGGRNDFIVWYIDNGKDCVARYAYDENMPTVPSQTLTVYSLNLSENAMIRQAASLFQMKNPDVRVEVIDGNSQSGGVSISDTIRALNTELLGGNGADVLILDGLPVNSYIEKGILEDIGDLVNPMIESGMLYSGIMAPFVEEDKSVYQAPARVMFPIVFGKEDAVESMRDLTYLGQYLDSHADEPLLSQDNYENILRRLVTIYYGQLTEGNARTVSHEALVQLLETAKKLGENCGAKVRFESGNEEEDNVYNSRVPDGFRGGGSYELFIGNTSMAVEMADGMMGMAMPVSVIQQKNLKLHNLNGICYPRSILGVNSGSRQKETARAFVSFVLSEEMQGNDLSDGFPVNSGAESAWAGRTSNVSLAISSRDTDIVLSANYPDESVRREIMSLLGKITTPILVDPVLRDMIADESKGYFEGTMTAEEAARAVENKTKLYEAESQ